MKIQHSFMALALLALTACSSGNPTQNIQSTSPVVESYTPENSIGITGIAPKSVDLFIYSNSTIYPTPELGYSLKYVAPSNMHADVYVFPVPEALNNESHQDIVKTMTMETIADIKEAERRGMYQDFNIIDQHLISMDQKVQGRMYGTFIIRGENAATAVYVTEVDGMLYKIRITQPEAGYDRSIASLWDNFANRMFKFLTENRDLV